MLFRSCDGYRLCRAAKLLMALGYGNFDTVIQYDVYSMAEIYMRDAGTWNESKFKSSDFILILAFMIHHLF